MDSCTKRKTADKWADCEVQAGVLGAGEGPAVLCASRRNEKVFLDISSHLDTLGYSHTCFRFEKS